jgi:succinate-semialdehyde dehydrogenase / glutarate-semialdehyde dehydrogenase
VGAASVESHPLGNIFGVQPWNFPYYQLARFAAPNIMAGNVVMVKHAGCVPQCALAFEKLWREAGAPDGLYTNLFVSHEQVNWVIDDPRVRGVAMSGSEEAGKRSWTASDSPFGGIQYSAPGVNCRVWAFRNL